MRKYSSSFAPANLSMFFTTGKTGSKGLGFTLTEGVSAVVSLNQNESENVVYFNSNKIILPIVEKVLEKISLKKFRVELKSTLPLGAGFGLSGSSGLCAGYAARDLIKSKMTDLQVARIVHSGEVQSGTGLGDVINEYFGGCCFKSKSSRFFQITSIRLNQKVIYYKVFATKQTKDLLNNPLRLKILNQSGRVIIAEFKETLKELKSISLKTILDLSYNFSFKSELISTQSQDIIDKIRQSGGAATTLLVGNGVVSNIPFEGSKKAKLFDNQDRI